MIIYHMIFTKIAIKCLTFSHKVRLLWPQGKCNMRNLLSLILLWENHTILSYILFSYGFSLNINRLLCNVVLAQVLGTNLITPFQPVANTNYVSTSNYAYIVFLAGSAATDRCTWTQLVWFRLHCYAKRDDSMMSQQQQPYKSASLSFWIVCSVQSHIII